jgi:predicted nucleic acid-binding protein
LAENFPDLKKFVVKDKKMKTLVDTSVWIAHFKKSDSKLISLLEADDVLLHPFIFQELYLGKPKRADFIFERLLKLPSTPLLSEEQFCTFVGDFEISGKGIGVIDTHLLASAYLRKVSLYTLDKKLSRLASALL